MNYEDLFSPAIEPEATAPATRAVAPCDADAYFKDVYGGLVF